MDLDDARAPLTQVGDLTARLAGAETQRPIVVDVRFRMGGPAGRQEFEHAHIPGASYVDMDTALATISADGVGGRHPMPTVETFTAAMRLAGVSMSRQVVAYDDWDSLAASRLWWMLRHFGFLNVRVLDGGMAAWIGAGQATESGPDKAGAGDFTPSKAGVGHLLDAADARRYAAWHGLLDARSADRFRGEKETIDAVAGHIPGAVSASTLDNVRADGRFRPADELAARFRGLGATHTKPLGTYCGSGVQATHLALALCVAGLPDADVYIGSWSDWITDPERDVET